MTQEDPEAPAEIKPLTLATPSGRNGRSHTITATFRCQLSTVVIVSLSIALVATWVFGVRKFTQIDMQLEMLKEVRYVFVNTLRSGKQVLVMLLLYLNFIRFFLRPAT